LLRALDEATRARDEATRARDEATRARDELANELAVAKTGFSASPAGVPKGAARGACLRHSRKP
jgi:hypothetical protein